MINPDKIESFAGLVKCASRRVVLHNYMKKIRWPRGVVCPYCGFKGAWSIKKRGKEAYRCGGCSNNFSVTAQTVFDNTKLPLRIWFWAIWLLWKTPTGISSVSLSNILGVTQPTAWLMVRRLSAAMGVKNSLNSSGVCRRSPFPRGLTFAEIVLRLCAAKPQRNLDPLRQR
jgi:transposase-like protein